MLITEVQVRVLTPPSPEGVLAYVHIVFDGQLALKDIRLIDRPGRDPLLCMPTRPKAVKCLACRTKNPLNHQKCHRCGQPIPRQEGDIFQDVAHPITREFRNYLEEQVLREYGRLTGQSSDVSSVG